MERLTKQRIAIIESVKELHHATLNEIVTLLKEKNNEMSLSTIYRNLDSLVEAKSLKRLDFKKNDEDVYEVNMNQDHDHFICLKCHSIIDKPKVFLDSKTLDSEGNTVLFKTVNEYGICKKCNQKEESYEEI